MGRNRDGLDAMAPALLCIIVAYLVIQRIRHERRLSRIPIRIHVNGIRGKSSVTWLIAAALRRSGIRTLAKTTGSRPMFLLPDGSEQTIRRWSPPNILEQIKTIKLADKMNVQAVVVECMALEPGLQLVCESAIIRSTIGVITNVRPDHFEVMGNNADGIAKALAGTIPSNGVLVTADRRYHAYFSEVASKRGTSVVLAGDCGFGDECVPQSDCHFQENKEIAQSVVNLLGLDPTVVSDCLDGSAVDTRNAVVRRVAFGDATIVFLDAFAANDIESTKIIQKRFLTQETCPRPWIALFNHRADRPLRMKSFADGLLAGSAYDKIVVVGEESRLAHRYLRRRIPEKEVLLLPDVSVERFFAQLPQDVAGKGCTIVGMGNEKGAGEAFSRFMRERSA